MYHIFPRAPQFWHYLPGLHYVDFRDKIIKTETSVFGSQALGAERRRSPSLAVKALMSHTEYTTEAVIKVLMSHTEYTTEVVIKRNKLNL